MGCRMSDFDVTSESQTLTINGHSVEIANATTKLFGLGGVLYKVDGRLRGFTGSMDAVRYWVDRDFPKV